MSKIGVYQDVTQRILVEIYRHFRVGWML